MKNRTKLSNVFVNLTTGLAGTNKNTLYSLYKLQDKILHNEQQNKKNLDVAYQT